MKIKIIQKFIDSIRGKKKPNKNIIKQHLPIIGTTQKSNRILLVYHNNFLKKDAGNNVYQFEIIAVLKELGFSIDFISTTKLLDNFDGFDQDNKKYNNLIDNLYLYRVQDETMEKHHYSSTTWVSDGFLDYFQQVISKNNYDYIYVHYVNFLDLIKFSEIDESTKVIFSMSDFNSLQEFYNKDTASDKFKDLGKNIQEEIELLQHCDEVLCISNDEKHFFSRFHHDKKFHFLPHFANAKKLPDKQKDIDCLFIAYSNFHNKNAVLWFIDNVYEHLNKDINITICGKICQMLKEQDPDYYQKIKDLKINTIDFAEDLDELYARTKFSISPMQSGTGLKIKTISSMAYGIPVVSTELGVDGFPDKTENGCLVSNDPQEFAEHINQLTKYEVFYNSVVKKTNYYFKKHFSYNNNVEKLKKIFEIK